MILLRCIGAALVALALLGCSEQKNAGAPSPPAAFSAKAPDEFANVPLESGGRCSVDTVNEQGSEQAWTVRKGTKVRIGGWIFDADRKATSDLAVLRLDGNGAQFFLPTMWRGERPDLTAALGASEAVKKASATFAGDTAVLGEGTYRIVLLHKPAAAAQACDTGKLLTIAP
jgi:hypothetical protein